jgi:hypothetical protein
LQRWYGFDIRVTDPTLLDRTITMSLDAESPTQAIELLCNVLHARVVREGSRVTLVRLSPRL